MLLFVLLFSLVSFSIIWQDVTKEFMLELYNSGSGVDVNFLKFDKLSCGSEWPDYNSMTLYSDTNKVDFEISFITDCIVYLAFDGNGKYYLYFNKTTTPPQPYKKSYTLIERPSPKIRFMGLQKSYNYGDDVSFCVYIDDPYDTNDGNVDVNLSLFMQTDSGRFALTDVIPVNVSVYDSKMWCGAYKISFTDPATLGLSAVLRSPAGDAEDSSFVQINPMIESESTYAPSYVVPPSNDRLSSAVIRGVQPRILKVERRTGVSFAPIRSENSAYFPYFSLVFALIFILVYKYKFL